MIIKPFPANFLKISEGSWVSAVKGALAFYEIVKKKFTTYDALYFPPSQLSFWISLTQQILSACLQMIRSSSFLNRLRSKSSELHEVGLPAALAALCWPFLQHLITQLT